MFLNCGAGEDSWESLDRKEIKPVNPKGNQPWIITGRTDTEDEVSILQPLDAKSWLIGKNPDAEKDWGQKKKGMTEDKMVRWHHQLNGHEFEQTLRDSEGQGNLACCSPWGCKESNTTKQLNNNDLTSDKLRSHLHCFHGAQSCISIFYSISPACRGQPTETLREEDVILTSSLLTVLVTRGSSGCPYKTQWTGRFSNHTEHIHSGVPASRRILIPFSRVSQGTAHMYPLFSMVTAFLSFQEPTKRVLINRIRQESSFMWRNAPLSILLIQALQNSIPCVLFHFC